MHAPAPRNEVRTGLFVVCTVAVLVAALVYLGAPGAFIRQHTYRIYFDNAAGIKPGADVMVGGRKVGQVERAFSPVPGGERPAPKYESFVEVRVAASAGIFKSVRVQMLQLTMLGDMMIDFSQGDESSGLAPDGAHFLGERQAGLSEVVPQVLERIDPVVKKTTETLDSLQKTSQNLNRLTSAGSDLTVAMQEFRKFGVHLNELSDPDGALVKSLDNLQTLTGTGSPLARTLENTERFTSDLADNRDLQKALRNARQASETLNATLRELGPSATLVGRNLEQASDTIKRQPWRLVWPATKSYDEDERAATPPPRARTASARQR